MLWECRRRVHANDDDDDDAIYVHIYFCGTMYVCVRLGTIIQKFIFAAQRTNESSAYCEMEEVDSKYEYIPELLLCWRSLRFLRDIAVFIVPRHIFYMRTWHTVEKALGFDKIRIHKFVWLTIYFICFIFALIYCVVSENPARVQNSISVRWKNALRFHKADAHTENNNNNNRRRST